MKRYLPIFIISLLSIRTSTLADLVYLKTGIKIEGMILSDTPESITIAIDIGTVTYSKTQIESISKSSDEDNMKLKGR